jgi:hypothetical protein
VDADGSGEIEFGEFLSIIKGGTGGAVSLYKFLHLVTHILIIPLIVLERC